MQKSPMDAASSWPERMRKAGDYVRRGNIGGLWDEIQQFVTWKKSLATPNAPRLAPGAAAANGAPGVGEDPGSLSESEWWDQFDKDLNRKIYWGNAADFGGWALKKMRPGGAPDIIEIISEMLTVASSEPRRGLILGCGDMTGEHTAFIDPRLPFDEVDAYDVSPQSLEQARQLTDSKGLKVNYHVADVNQIELPPDRYALGLVFHAFHHFEAVDHVAQQINRSLAPGGVFYTFDYVGPARLQFSERQLFYSQQILKLLPPERRHEWNGAVRDQAQSVPLDQISPDEAICSDQILAALGRHLDVKWQYNWAGLLYPLLDGIAHNFTQSPDDQAFMRFLFNLDYALCNTGEIEPNFTITLANKRMG